MPLYNKLRNLKRKMAKLELQNKQLRKKKLKLAKRKSTAVCPPTAIIPGSVEPLESHEIQVTAEIHTEPTNDATAAVVPTEQEKIPETPGKSAKSFLKAQGLSPTKFPLVTQEITSFRTLAQHISDAPKKLKSELMKKRRTPNKRCSTYLSSKLGMGRRSVLTPRTQKQRDKISAIKKNQVIQFLMKSENSTPMPSKKDILQKGKVQRYTLNDTIANLYSRFIVENPTIKIGRATFARFRPTWIKPIQWLTRRQCLCHIHQNSALKLRAMKQEISPNVFIQKNDDAAIAEVLESIPGTQIRYQTWKKEEIMYEGRLIKKLRLNTMEVSKQQFVDTCKQEFKELQEHVRRATAQFREISNLRNSLQPMTEITCQLDYSENYACVYQDEPSAVFFDRKQVTVHPMVIHYKDLTGSMQHISYVGLSDEKLHSAPTTLAFITKMYPELKKVLPDISMVHFISDSPSSQYRNRSIMKLLANHPAFFNGISASWQYLEKGHGKGPCDGVGGSLKKSADQAVKKGEIISNAHDMLKWSQKFGGSITCILVTAHDINEAEKKLRNSEYVKGISAIHSVRSYQGYLWIRETSCFNLCCASEPACLGWMNTGLQVNTVEQPMVPEENPVPLTRERSSVTTEAPGNDETEDEIRPVETDDGQETHYGIGEFVEADYLGKHYFGKIMEYSSEEKDYLIRFLKKGRKNKYVWPKRVDEVWVMPSNILRVVSSQDLVIE
jgi:hypothetical protein